MLKIPKLNNTENVCRLISKKTIIFKFPSLSRFELNGLFTMLSRKLSSEISKHFRKWNKRDRSVKRLIYDLLLISTRVCTREQVEEHLYSLQRSVTNANIKLFATRMWNRGCDFYHFRCIVLLSIIRDEETKPSREQPISYYYVLANNISPRNRTCINQRICSNVYIDRSYIHVPIYYYSVEWFIVKTFRIYKDFFYLSPCFTIVWIKKLLISLYVIK